MKLILIYKVPGNHSTGVDVHDVEDDISEQELKDYKNELIDECEQRLIPAIVLEQHEAVDVAIQIQTKLLK